MPLSAWKSDSDFHKFSEIRPVSRRKGIPKFIVPLEHIDILNQVFILTYILLRMTLPYMLLGDFSNTAGRWLVKLKTSIFYIYSNHSLKKVVVMAMLVVVLSSDTYIKSIGQQKLVINNIIYLC